MQKSTHERVQAFIRGLEQGIGARLLKGASVVMGFVLLALWYNSENYKGFTSVESMESAHLARQIATGQGYTTDSIRPLVVGMLQRADTNHAAEVLQRPVPDLSNPPIYSCILAVLMKVLPFHFTATEYWYYQPEFLIACFNEALFFVAALLLFRVARRLFDDGVAWVSAILFVGSETYWRHSISGLSTMWLVVVFLAVAWCLAALEAREEQETAAGKGGSTALAVLAGALVGLGGLSRYSFGWLIAPVLLFLLADTGRQRGKLWLWAGISFLVVMGPWVARNLVLSGTPFGTASYALVENTPALPDDHLERSLYPNAAGLARLTSSQIVNKLLMNGGEILGNELPRLGGNWVCAFFLCGLLLPYRSGLLRRFRLFLIWSLALMVVVQALGKTHLSADSPGINSENMMVLLAPLVMVFGTSVFFTLLDQISHPDAKARGVMVWAFTGLMCLPMILSLLAPTAPEMSPYSPRLVQRTAGMMQPGELLMSDIPWAAAWYGGQPCVWLTVDDAGTFEEFNQIKPVRGIYLTERTSDRRFLSQMIENQQSWEYFMLDSMPTEWAQSEVPTGFGAKYGLTNEALDYLPDQMFISNSNRWRMSEKP